MRPASTAVLLLLAAACASDSGGPTAGSAAADPGAAAASASAPEASEALAEGLYGLRATTLEGAAVDLADYSGQVALVVNVASRCGYTGQYAGLQELYDELADRGFAVLAFPSNEFGGQEPGDAEQIRAFCTSSYGVSFPLFAKCEVKPGGGQSPVYAYLQQQTGEVPGWNFCKYLVGRDGQVIAFFESGVAPDAAELRKAIEDALG